jgi:hypothetical protein
MEKWVEYPDGVAVGKPTKSSVTLMFDIFSSTTPIVHTSKIQPLYSVLVGGNVTNDIHNLPEDWRLLFPAITPLDKHNLKLRRMRFCEGELLLLVPN